MTLRVLFLSSEVVPFAKTGGLADVAGALPQTLRALGHDVVTITPGYSSIDDQAYGIVRAVDRHGVVDLTAGSFAWRAWTHRDTDTWFIDVDGLYSRSSLYTDDQDEHVRFTVFQHAALQLASRLGHRFDVIHCNDWQTGLVPALVRGPGAGDVTIGGVPTVLSIHNLGYQGTFAAWAAIDFGLDGHLGLLHQGHLREGRVSMLETGIMHATAITTVSPTYAEEIQTPIGGAGLDALLRQRSGAISGILNGIDTTVWNPRLDPHIPFRYSEKSLWRKERDKEALCSRLGLAYRKHVPLVGVISRLAYQKGIEIMRGPLIHFLDTWDVRVAVLGSGATEYETFFRWLAHTYPSKVAFVDGFHEDLAHQIEAGADIFLMPSLYEPCGLNQMYSLAYGTIPVVRRVGGLADTVSHVEASTGTGTGFVFDHFTEEGLGWALGQALDLHRDRKTWQTVQKNGMAIDNSWERRAGEYAQLYSRLGTTSPQYRR